MSEGIDSYDELSATLGRWLKSSTTAIEIPGLIALAETTLRRRLRRLLGARTTIALTASGGTMTLPADFGGVVELTVEGHPWPVEPVAIQHLHGKPPSSGAAELYAVSEGKLHFWPAAPDAASLTYSKGIPALSSQNSTNWLLVEAPDVYLFTAAALSSVFGMNDDRLPTWERMRETAIADLLADSDAQAFGSGPLVCRRAG